MEDIIKAESNEMGFEYGRVFSGFKAGTNGVLNHGNGLGVS
jgi:hypothetical protein